VQLEVGSGLLRTAAQGGNRGGENRRRQLCETRAQTDLDPLSSHPQASATRSNRVPQQLLKDSDQMGLGRRHRKEL
jgi:hypothetical protein